jgi:hypothetical protein
MGSSSSKNAHIVPKNNNNDYITPYEFNLYKKQYVSNDNIVDIPTFMKACDSQSLETIQKLWNISENQMYQMYNINEESLFMMICRHKRHKRVLGIIKFIWEISKDTCEIDDKNGYSDNAFMLVCRNKQNLDIVKWLWEISKDKINIEDKNINGNTAFMLACKNNNLDVVKWLWEISKDKINIEDKDNKGDSIYNLSQKFNKINVIEWLLRLNKSQSI